MASSETRPPRSIFLRHREDESALGEKSRRRALIYFICGNPGLIEFYEGFLAHLRQLVSASASMNGVEVDLYGRSLVGFDDEDHHPPFSAPDNVPLDLEGQICSVYENVAEVVSNEAKRTGGKGYGDVILMGHSVGAYIATEVTHRHLREEEREGWARHVRLRHGFLLFPTLTHIAASPSGRRMQLLRQVPLMDSYFHVLARGLLGVIPEAAVRWLVGRVVGVSRDGGMAAVLARWLKSRDGVWQAVHLGKSEMETIREEVWEERLWGMAEEGEEGGAPRFFILYGKEDHWVANHLRDEFIARRRKDGGETRIEVDEGDLPHAFCLKEEDYKQVAQTVLEWLEEIEDGRA
ncbi:unnamed protein product [Clonostachys chloroleuca]|uniref:Lipid droplet-associated hydrolase n=1 Tax=Clonostachys chloroleuca TaxID=1926264 RepID=A0AA35Q159_9HYPO|nr:unnamed protein product [Clonostachys chloroleuca]